MAPHAIRRPLAPLLLLAACGGPAEQAAENPLTAPPVDSARVRIEDAEAWPYRRALAADLDGDGAPERVVIAADATLGADGAPLWEDGHRWAVYAESAAGERTLLYGAFVPNGVAEAAVVAADSGGRREVLVQERTPSRLRAVTISYGGPGEARTVSDAYYHPEAWLPGSATMPSPPPFGEAP